MLNRLFLSLVCFMLLIVNVKAQQLAGGELTYTCLGSDQYSVKLVMYAKCPNPNLPPVVSLSVYSRSTALPLPNVNMTPSGADETILACLGKPSKCQGGTGDAIIKRSYTATISLPKKLNDWLLIVQEGPRTPISALPSQDLMNLTALINNTGTICNSSVSFENNPLFFSSSSLSVTSDPGLKNTDNDKLLVQLVAPATTSKKNVVYNAPYSATNPFSTNGPLVIDANNGKLSFTPNKENESSTLSMQVTESRNGVVVGTVARELYFQTLPALSSPPFFTGGDTIKLCFGESVNISYEGLSNDQNAKLDIILNNKARDWSSASVSVNNSIKGRAILQLTSPSLPLNTVRPLNLTLVDENCGAVTKTVYVKVYPKPTTPASSDTTVLCLKPFTISVKPTGGVKPYTFKWTNSSQTESTITVAAAGTYTATVEDVNGCKATWTKRVISPINFAKGPVSCVDSSIAFYDVSSGTPNPLRANPQSKTQVWKWSFGDQTPDGSGPSPRHKFPDSDVVKSYNVTMEVSDGASCTNTITKAIRIFPKPKANFSILDSCQVTPRSDLKVADLSTSDTTIRFPNIEYLVDGLTKSKPDKWNVVSGLAQEAIGIHTVTMIVKDDAGCVSTFSKKVTIGARPIITLSPKNATYFYRCDSPGFPDTTFAYTAHVESNAIPLKIEVVRFGMTTLTIPGDGSDKLVSVPYTVKQNLPKPLENYVNFKTEDKFGCTNDVKTTIIDPIDPVIKLVKYYCYDGDTLKLNDATYLTKGYHWGLSTSLWDMKEGTQTTIGSVKHKYLKQNSLDKALVVLGVKDNTGCTDSTTFQVYLSEPDTSQFQIIKPLACFADTVRITSIKNSYINSWYFRYKDTTALTYRVYDKEVINGDFGNSVPTNLDAVQMPLSNRYLATTTIFYNEADPMKNFTRDTLKPGKPQIIPRVIAKPEVCHISATKKWRVVERLRFSINDTYNKCFGFDKSFDVKSLDPGSVNMRVADSTWSWSVHAPAVGGQNKMLQSTPLVKNNPMTYIASQSLFTDVVSPRSSPVTNPYLVKIKYKYTNDTITCTDSASLTIINEKVELKLDDDETSCANYSLKYQYSKVKFLELNELDSTIWYYGDGIQHKGRSEPHQYDTAGVYQYSVFATNKYGCHAADTMLLTIKPSPKAVISVAPVCLGNMSILDGSRSKATDTTKKVTNFYWYYAPSIPLTDDANVPNIALAYRNTKDGKDTIMDYFPVGNTPVGLAVEDNGCFSMAPIQFVKVNPLPPLGFTAVARNTQDEDYLGNEPIDFKPTPETVAYTSEWHFGNGDKQKSGPADTVNFPVSYTYPYYAPPFPIEKNKYNVSLLVKTKEGCVDSVSKEIDVNAYFVLPNAFSPNEDGLHDQVLGVGKGIKDIKEFKVFNRWGEVVYTTSGKPAKDALNKGYILWSGEYNGAIQPVGAYVYYAVVTTGYGDDLIVKGNLTLLR